MPCSWKAGSKQPVQTEAPTSTLLNVHPRSVAIDLPNSCPRFWFMNVRRHIVQITEAMINAPQILQTGLSVEVPM